MPIDKGVALEKILVMQEKHVKKHTTILEAKNREVETAVDNIIELVRNYTIAKQLEPVSELEIAKLHRHYNNMMYTALLNSAKKFFERIEKAYMLSRRQWISIR